MSLVSPIAINTAVYPTRPVDSPVEPVGWQRFLAEALDRQFSVWSRSARLIADGDATLDDRQARSMLLSINDDKPQLLAIGREDPCQSNGSSIPTRIAWLAVPQPGTSQGPVALAPFLIHHHNIASGEAPHITATAAAVTADNSAPHHGTLSSQATLNSQESNHLGIEPPAVNPNTTVHPDSNNPDSNNPDSNNPDFDDRESTLDGSTDTWLTDSNSDKTPAGHEWRAGQLPWYTAQLMQIATVCQARIAAELGNQKLESEIEQISSQLSSTYEEISLLYGVTQNLRLSQTDEDLATLVLDWLLECLPAEGVAIHLLPVAGEHQVTYKVRVKSAFLTDGQCPVDFEQFEQLTNRLELTAGSQPFVANQVVTSRDDWGLPTVRQIIVTPLYEGDKIFGWLAAFNHRDGQEFGTVEASLLSSLGAILGIHAGNFDLYREQGEFLASVVRALSSAIDAKDPYTCGHSDRVARISVRLAKEVGFTPEQLNVIYMAGLLHDIGKIGIDDNVLRKPGRLTEAEFEHIKMHPELGHRILADIKQFEQLLPAVLHHHEQWDGQGYPHGLSEDNIPRIARVLAVADAYDAMTSDRPYRKGMGEERVNEIFRAGAGQQWDADVVQAYFDVIEDVRHIANHERANLTLDVQQWT